MAEGCPKSGANLPAAVRIAAGLMLTTLLWKLLLPGAATSTLIAVATLRPMVQRLPLVPACDALLAPLVLALLGTPSGPAAAVMLVATLVLATHLVVGGASPLRHLFTSAKRRV